MPNFWGKKLRNIGFLFHFMAQVFDYSGKVT